MARPELGRVSQDTRDLITWVLGTITTLIVISATVVRFVLVPYVRDHLVQPVRDVHRQVTENHHSNVNPTLPDLIDDVSREVHALAGVVEGHLNSSDRWLSAMLRRLDALEDVVRRHHPQ
jgi:hypothetical protein